MSLTGKPSLSNAAAVANDGFWPDMALGDLMSKYRIPSEYENEVIETGLQLAIIRVNEKLDRAKAAIIVLGHAAFDDYINANPEPVGTTEVMLVNYQHAVFSRAKAFLLQQFNTLNRRDKAENENKESAMTEQFWMDESQRSIGSIMKVFFPLEQFAGNAGVHVASL